MDKQVKKGDFVLVNYKGTFDDGEVFDASEGREPLKFQAGVGQVIKGFDDAIVGMKVGDKKKFRVPPEQAYGMPDKELVKAIPKSQVPSDMNLKAGMTIQMSTAQGYAIPITIVKVTETEVYLDMNHPLAGKALNFEITVEKILDKKDMECSCGSECSCEHDCECGDESCKCGSGHEGHEKKQKTARK